MFAEVLAHVVVLVLGAYVGIARDAHDVFFHDLIGAE